MQPTQPTPRAPLPRGRSLGHVRRAVAAIAGVALTASLLTTGPATAAPRVERPTPEPGAPTLPAGTLVHLAANARNVQVQQSPAGGTTAVVWQNPAATQIWARLRTGNTWRKKVRLSRPAARASRPSIDLDSDGSLLVGWTERQGGNTRVVARRLKNAKPGPRRVFRVNPSQAPQVGAGQFQDIIAWTTRTKNGHRPFVSVDAGSGFKAPARITGPHPTFPGTLRVNSDGPQSHLVHITRDVKKRVARSAWAVLDPKRAKRWRTFADVGPRQRYDEQRPEAPVLTFHQANRAVMVFTNEQIAEEVDLPEAPAQIPAVRQRWSAAATWGSRPRPLRGFGKWTELHNPPAQHAPDRVTHLRNVRGSVVAAHSGDQGLLNVLLAPGAATFDLQSTTIMATCRPFPDWFLPDLPATRNEPPTLTCVDNEATSSAQVLADLHDNPLRTLAPRARGAVRATVPDPLVAALVVTEETPGARNPVWLHDLAPRGRDTRQPPRTFTRTKAGRFKGAVRVGRTLTAMPGQWSPAPARIRYQWFAGNKRLPKQTGRTLRLRPHMRGKMVRVKVTVVRDGHRNRTVTMKPKRRVR